MRETLQMCVSVSNIEANSLHMIGNLVHDKLRHAIADKIALLATVVTQHEYHKEYRCRVIVADYDDYWRDVKEAAERMSYRGTYPRFIEEGF